MNDMSSPEILGFVPELRKPGNMLRSAAAVSIFAELVTAAVPPRTVQAADIMPQQDRLMQVIDDELVRPKTELPQIGLISQKEQGPTPTTDPPAEVVVGPTETPQVVGMEWRPPTVDEMVVKESSPTEDVGQEYEAMAIDGLKALGIEVSSIEKVAVGFGDFYRWIQEIRDKSNRILWAQGVDGKWMDWPAYYVKGADGKFSLATEVGGQPITYKPVPGSEYAHGIFEGDVETGKVLPILAKQAVPTTDKGSVYSQYADMMKEEIEWKTVENIGKVTTLPEYEKDIWSAVKNGWEWKVTDGEGMWIQNIVRNERGEIPLEDSRTVKLIGIKHVQGGKCDFTEESGLNPLPNSKCTLKALPAGYEYSQFTFEGFNFSDNNMRPYGDFVRCLLESGSTSMMSDNKANRTTPGDKYTRLNIFIPHKIGDEVSEITLSKTKGSQLHKVYSVSDFVTVGLQPK